MFKHLKENDVEICTLENRVDVNGKEGLRINIEGIQTNITLEQAHRLKRVLSAFLLID